MVRKDQNIEYINHTDIKCSNTVHMFNCIINTIDLIGVFELKTHLIIENCIINNFHIHSCWFLNGLTFKNSVVKNPVDYQMGGHNIKPIVLEGSVFMGFFNFFDCQFYNIIELRNNVFMRGTNLLGNKGEGFENRFERGWLVENNVGNIDLNVIE